jgi:hypothetical protein
MANRLGFHYHSACGPKGNDAVDETCHGGTYEADIGRVVRLTRAALKEHQKHQRDHSLNGMASGHLSSCVQNAKSFMRSHDEAVRTSGSYDEELRMRN